ncbi:hypothetical protein P7K49_024372 [Saguinus oedipus]|uniref:Uncharacterized protein n=1 Tax=Saguinus oedipus TaxID=9490 RepID=A0ABQ9UPD8_SAGOE|nr:hypothetical protein P7K49_024372 [Saguinus oedipus]
MERPRPVLSRTPRLAGGDRGRERNAGCSPNHERGAGMGAWPCAAPRTNGKVSGWGDDSHRPPLHAKFPTERRVTLVYVRGKGAWPAGTREPVKDERCRKRGGASELSAGPVLHRGLCSSSSRLDRPSLDQSLAARSGKFPPQKLADSPPEKPTRQPKKPGHRPHSPTPPALRSAGQFSRLF